jgi:hypothetical protein
MGLRDAAPTEEDKVVARNYATTELPVKLVVV